MGTRDRSGPAKAPSSATRRLRQGRGLLVRRTTHSAVILGDGPAAVVLEGTAADAWDAFHEPRSVMDVVDLLARRYDVESLDIYWELWQFAGELVDAGLLTEVPAGGGRDGGAAGA